MCFINLHFTYFLRILCVDILATENWFISWNDISLEVTRGHQTPRGWIEDTRVPIIVTNFRSRAEVSTKIGVTPSQVGNYNSF